jgi:uncharacterized membrane protein YvbJ
MKCTKCGVKVLQENINFCGNCGYHIISNQDTKQVRFNSNTKKSIFIFAIFIIAIFSVLYLKGTISPSPDLNAELDHKYISSTEIPTYKKLAEKGSPKAQFALGQD